MGRRKLKMFPTRFEFRGERSKRTVELFGTLVDRMEKLQAVKMLPKKASTELSQALDPMAAPYRSHAAHGATTTSTDKAST
jgi:hypothetical protein